MSTNSKHARIYGGESHINDKVDHNVGGEPRRDEVDGDDRKIIDHL